MLTAGTKVIRYLFSTLFWSASGLSLFGIFDLNQQDFLDILAAVVFPVMLDYIYNSQQLNFMVKTSEALCYLAQYSFSVWCSHTSWTQILRFRNNKKHGYASDVQVH